MKEMTKETYQKIIEVGNAIAKQWKMECEDFETFPKKKEIKFLVVNEEKQGETTISFAHIKAKYNLDVETILDGVRARRIGKNSGKVSKELYAKLLEVGEDVAMGWGAECYDLSVDFMKDEVTFECIEHGEFFVTTLSFDDIKEEYEVVVA